MNESDNYEKDMAEREAILFMLNEIESIIDQNSKYTQVLERLLERFHRDMNLSKSDKQLLRGLYERVTDISL